MNLQDRRRLLEQAMENNKMCSVLFKKADGQERAATICPFAEKGFASGDKNIVQKNTTEHKPEIYTAWDVNNKKWIKINLHNLLRLRFKEVEVNFNLTKGEAK